jgi:type IV pilus assembly protein PilA
MHFRLRSHIPGFIARARAFTLIELLIVVLIIGILIAIAAPAFLGETTKAEDSVAQQNLYNVYVSGKGAAYTDHEAYPYVGDPVVNLGCPGDSNKTETFSTDCIGGTTTGSAGSLFADLDDSEPEFTFSEGVSPTDVNQIEVGELNPQEVYYADQSESGHIFCLVDIEQSNYDGDGVPAGTYHLEGDAATGFCNTLLYPSSPSPVTPAGITSSQTPPPCATANSDCTQIVKGNPTPNITPTPCSNTGDNCTDLGSGGGGDDGGETVASNGGVGGPSSESITLDPCPFGAQTRNATSVAVGDALSGTDSEVSCEPYGPFTADFYVFQTTPGTTFWIWDAAYCASGACNGPYDVPSQWLQVPIFFDGVQVQGGGGYIGYLPYGSDEFCEEIGPTTGSGQVVVGIESDPNDAHSPYVLNTSYAEPTGLPQGAC